MNVEGGGVVPNLVGPSQRRNGPRAEVLSPLSVHQLRLGAEVLEPHSGNFRFNFDSGYFSIDTRLKSVQFYNLQWNTIYRRCIIAVNKIATKLHDTFPYRA